MGGHRIEHVEHGILVYGQVALSDLSDLVLIGERAGWTIVDALVSGHLDGVSMAFTDEAHSKLWRIDLGLDEDDGLRPCPICGRPTEMEHDGSVKSCDTCLFGDRDAVHD